MPDGLDPEQVITRDMLMLVASTHLEALEQKQYQLAINHIFGTQTMPVRVAQYQIADTPEGLERLLTRFAAYPAAIEQEIETLREGIADGRTAAAVPVRKEIEQIERMVAAPAAKRSRRSTMAHVADDAARERVRAAVEAHIYPALQPAPRLPGRRVRGTGTPRAGDLEHAGRARRPIGSGSA